MKISPRVAQVCAVALLLAACAPGGGQATAVPTVNVPVIVATATATALPTSAGENTPWSHLGITGRLMYSLGIQGIHVLDLATAQEKTIFTLPDQAWLTAASISADANVIVLAYAPPPGEGAVQLGYTSIYELPGECLTRATSCTPDDLTLLVDRTDPHEAYFSPIWSPDGRYVYFAHFTPSSADSASPFAYTLERLPMTGGAATGPLEVVLKDALWPALSADGSQMVYVYSDPKDYTNHLFIASADGTNVRELTDPGNFDAVDAPLFTLDGQTVIFSAVGDGPAVARPNSPLAWLDRLTGVKVAEAGPLAHNVPSDWWSIPAAGGTPTRLSNIYDTGMFGDLSPDGQYMAYISASGLYALAVTGGEPEKLLAVSGFGTLEWIP